LKTLKIVESRGYNLSIEKLSENLIGGSINPDELEEIIDRLDNIDYDGTFVASPKMLKTAKCERRARANGKYQKRALEIAGEFTEQYVRLNPWVKCVMVTGSAATGGFCEEDDIDLNIIVKDKTKYTSYVLAILLSLKYSKKYGKLFGPRYIRGVPKVICINVMWEEHQVKPFVRQDEQMAFELFNSKVLYNNDFFDKMVESNDWLNIWFPQMAEMDYRNGFRIGNNVRNPNGGARNPPFIEPIARKSLFSLFKLVRLIRSRKSESRGRMEFVERAKYPYGIFNVPERN
jgi:predicted nucleotidyltransferase